jgi:hypothetical protein
MALRLVGEVTLDGAGFERGLSRIGASAAANLKSFVVGAFGIYGIQQAITKTVQSCDELVHASEKLGVTVEQLQVMRQAAKEGGIEFDKLVASANKLAAIRGNILQGGKGAGGQLSALQRLGVTPDQIRNMTGMQMMMGPIASKVNQVNPADIASELKTVFGRAFGELIPVLKTDFGELQKKMENLGIIISTKTAVSLKVMQDEFSLLGGIIVEFLAPHLVTLGEVVFWLIGQIKEAGTFLGTFFDPKQHSVAALKENLGNILSGNKGFWETIGEGFQPAVNATTEVASKNEREAQSFYQKLADAAFRIAHPTPADISRAVPGLDKLREWKPTSDALLSVGNFLGSGRGAIGNVAQQHLEVARQQLDRLDKLNDNMEKLVDQGGDDMDFGN